MRWLWVWASLGLGGMGGLGAGPGEAIAEEPVREETLQSLSRLRQEDVREPRRVRVRGVVSTVGDGICSPDDWRVRSAYFYLEEGSGALWVPVFRARERGVWRGEEEFAKVEPGMEVEVEGDLSEGGFAPMLVPRTVRVLGRKALGPPLDPEWREVFTGGLRARRVRLSGVVQDVRLHRSVSAQVQAKVETGLGHFYVWLPERPEYAPGRLLDAEVEVTGAAVVLANWRGEFGHLRLMPMRAEDVVFRKQPGADPFEVEKVPLERLDSYVPGGRPLHRRRIEGEATYVSAASLPKPFVVVQSGGCAVRVHWAGEFPAGLRVGSRVEASGFIEASREVSDLSGAVLRVVGGASGGGLRGVEAVPLSFETVSQEMERRWAGRGSGVPHGYDGLLVRLSGRLLSVQRIGASRVNLELMGKGGVSTVEWSAEGRGGREPVLREGSELEVTGVAEVQYRPRPQLAEPVRMNVLIRDWGDVRVVHAAPWMNAKRAGMLLGGALTVALLGLGWAVLLRRLLGRKTRELADAIRGRKDAAIEFEASLRERARLSANLHDTVLQDVTGLGLQMGSAVSMLSRNAVSEAGEALGVAWRMAQRCQEDLRNAVWALQALPAGEGTLVEAVEKLAREYRTLHRLEVVVVAEENLPLLADFVAGNLLLVIREAVHNAMKHAQAREIRIDLGADPGGGGFRVGVSDHGIGMGPEAMQGGTGGHFGLQGMRERVRRLGGTVEIESRPGAGTRIAVRVPLQTFDRELA